MTSGNVWDLPFITGRRKLKQAGKMNLLLLYGKRRLVPTFKNPFSGFVVYLVTINAIAHINSNAEITPLLSV